MIPQADFFGGADERTMSADLQLKSSMKRVLWLKPQFAGTSVLLPAATGLPMGGPLFILLNKESDSVALKDSASTLLATLTANKAVVVSLADNSTAAGVWVVQEFQTT